MMTVEEINQIFETDFANPGAYKSGEYLEQLILKHAAQILKKERTNLVKVLQQWILSQKEPHTMLAVSVARDLRLTELKPDIRQLRDKIINNRVFPLYYADAIEKTIKML